nr:MAG TPA: hypothetical protein [Caudoviricetes sp.]
MWHYPVSSPRCPNRWRGLYCRRLMQRSCLGGAVCFWAW